MAARKPKDIVSFTLRLREDLRAQLEAAAEKSGVSLNQEIVGRLRASFDQNLLRSIEEKIIELESATEGDIHAKLTRLQGELDETRAELKTFKAEAGSVLHELWMKQIDLEVKKTEGAKPPVLREVIK